MGVSYALNSKNKKLKSGLWIGIDFIPNPNMGPAFYFNLDPDTDSDPQSH
jgi:hypothetical protein